MTGMLADNSFSVSMCDVPVDLPHRDDGTWSLRELLAWAPENSDWHLKKRCDDHCKHSCMVVPEGTLIEVPDDDALEIRIVAPAEFKRRVAENRMWAEDSA
ncbi:MAG: hypothetical protein HOV68_00015 [Streptomycetaceae bacterium]|nr:hypothetical protein [Streptomycetaceae bacterium]